MKDQYANYVVQKVLETCDDQQRELLLSRIKVHLHALKKYTYGKHIVARVEKLVAAGGKLIFQCRYKFIVNAFLIVLLVGRAPECSSINVISVLDHFRAVTLDNP